MAKTVLITGASGSIGKATIQALGQSADVVSVKAGVRDPAKPDASALASLAPNVSVVAADPLKTDDIAAALQGVDYVYVIAPGHVDRQKIAIAAIDAAKAAGVKFILVLSVLTADLPDTVFGGQFAPVEAQVKAAGIPYTILRLPLFLENNYGFAETIKGHGAFYSSYEPDKPFTPVSVTDAGAVAAKILSDPSAHHNKTYVLTSPPHTAAQLADAFTAALGKPVQYTQVPYEASKEWLTSHGFPEWQADGIIDLFKLINSASPITNSQEGAATVEAILGRPAVTVTEWVNAHAAGFK